MTGGVGKKQQWKLDTSSSVKTKTLTEPLIVSSKPNWQDIEFTNGQWLHGKLDGPLGSISGHQSYKVQWIVIYYWHVLGVNTFQHLY